MTLLDYSAGKISGAAIKAAGHAGAIRYITDRNSLGTKHTSPSEYADHVRNGLTDWLAYEVNTNDPLAGRAGGVAAAQRALDGANFIGYPADRHIFFCFDRHATAAELPTWQAYLDGAASVLGVGRTGAYGFSEAIDAAKGHATAFWQCGSRSAVRSVTNFYQRNTGTTVVGGITCDINDVLIPIQEDDLQADERDALMTILRQVRAPSTWQVQDGWLAGALGNTNTTLPRVEQDVTELAAAVADLKTTVTTPVDIQALAAAVAPLVSAAVGDAVAQAVAAELAKRLEA